MPRNSSLFRDVNERIHELGAGWDDSSTLGFLCECEDADCVLTLELTLADYESVRSTPAHFLLLRGHESPGAEDVVAQSNGYVIVEKRAEPY